MPLPSDHNVNGIRHAAVRNRAAVDEWYRETHDALTVAYRNGIPYSAGGHDFGVLSEAMFDRLHELIWHLYLLRFHWVNNHVVLVGDRADVAEYRYEYDEDGVTVLKDRLATAIARRTAIRALLVAAGKDIPDGWTLTGSDTL